MQFVDLQVQQKRIKERIDSRIQQVLSHGQYIMGPEVKELEERLAGYVGTRHAVGCASGTDALLLALMAYGVGPGDAVFTTPFTFIATAEVISLLGAVPVFVDIEPRTFNIDPSKLSLAIEAVRKSDPDLYPLPRTIDKALRATAKGVIGVDLFGLPADYDRINLIGRENGLFVIEDAAQSFGATLNGKKSCALAEVACTSFFPAKPLGCYGDGGMCFTDDDHLAAIMDSLRVHGKGEDKYNNVRIGVNGRLDTLQAAILLVKFDIFPEEIELRNQVAERYTRLLSPHPSLLTPDISPGARSAWAQYSIMAGDGRERQAMIERLKVAGIPAAVYYPKPLHLQTAFAPLGYKEGDFPESEIASRRIFSLPMHPYLAMHDQERIAQIMMNGA